MTIYALPGSTSNAVAENAAPGLVGTITFGIRNMDGTVFSAAATTGIIEVPTATGIYVATRVFPIVEGFYLGVWFDGSNYVTEEIQVTFTLPASVASGPYLCTLADVKLALGFESDSTQKDAEITDLLPTATVLLEAHSRRNFTNPGVSTKRLAFNGGFLGLPDLQAAPSHSITRVSDATLLVEESDYFFEPVGGDDYGLYSYASTSVSSASWIANQSASSINRKARRVLVDVTGTWGFATVPELAKRAAVTAIGAWVSKGAAAMRGSDDGQGPPVSPVATWTLPFAARDIISDLCIRGWAG